MAAISLIPQVTRTTLLIVVVSFLASLIPIKTELPKIVRQDVSDYDLYDLHYAGIDGANSRDKDIVLVESAESRRDIAAQIELLQSLDPAVIGVDILFNAASEDTLGDLQLQRLAAAPHITWASIIERNKEEEFAQHSSYFIQNAAGNQQGYINFIGEEHTAIRSWSPSVKLGDSTYLSFTAAIANKYAPDAFNRLMKRNSHSAEAIDYVGNTDHYTHFSATDLEYFNQSNQLADKIKDKIVLLGFFKTKPQPLVMEDLHFTPMNERISGKSFPDTYGIVIHANILSMILAGNYQRAVPAFFSYLIAAIILFFLTWWELWYEHRFKKNPPLYTGLAKLLLLVLLFYFFILLFNSRQVRFPLYPFFLAFLVQEFIHPIQKILAAITGKARAYFTKWKLSMKSWILLTILLSGMGAAAQLPEYYVDLLKGDVTQQHGKAKPVRIKPKDFLFKDDVITIPKSGATVTLVNKDAYYITLSEKGTYKVKDLSTRLKNKASSISQKYFRLVWEEFENPSKPMASGVEQMVNTWGGVSRGNCFTISMPLNGSVNGDEVLRFHWYGIKDSLYRFSLMDDHSMPVFEILLRDTQVMVPRRGLPEKGSTTYQWTVMQQFDPCSTTPEVYTFTWLSSADYEARLHTILPADTSSLSVLQQLEVAERLYNARYYSLAADYLRMAARK